ncbi:MAG: phosphoribosyltransferase family protein, partial [bacterium]|nr:phosphoribosyltransferase family protein [bacterium]
PDSILLGKRVAEVRKNLGRLLAKEANIKADVVIPVPDSAVPAALGYAEASKIPFDFGLVKNRYIGRTFIMPDQRLRDRGVQMKLNPIRESIEGKSVIVIDDSIVRGTTAKKLVRLLRDAGAKKVHMMSSCPPMMFPDFYGINTPTQEELIATTMPLEKIKTFIGADSLHYLSYEGLIKATGLPESTFCTSCFTGNYPIDIGENEKRIKRRLDGFSAPVVHR